MQVQIYGEAEVPPRIILRLVRERGEVALVLVNKEGDMLPQGRILKFTPELDIATYPCVNRDLGLNLVGGHICVRPGQG